MNWFYEDNGQPLGPVSREYLEELIRSGRIPKSTLVCREGFEGWKPVSEVESHLSAKKSPPPIPSAAETTADSFTTRCSFCGKAVLEEDLISISDRAVCAICKPVFLQQIREGVVPSFGPTYGGFLPRVGAKVVDMVIMAVIGLMTSMGLGFLVFGTPSVAFNPLPGMESWRYDLFQNSMTVLQFLLSSCLFAWMMARSGSSPGKRIFGLRVIRADGGRLTFLRGLARCFAEILSASILLIGYLVARFDGEKRTLHDRICDTLVLTKS